MSQLVSIPPATHVGTVSLTVADMARSLRFYADVLGLHQVAGGDGRVQVGGADGAPLLELVEVRGAPPKPQHATGLYHFAVLVPDRVELARWLRHVVESRGSLQGWADHGVSEAIYLGDPDGNGIEVYRDRPRAEWPVRNGQLQMVADPLDAHGLLALVDGDASPWLAMPAGTTMGHIHLHVADIAAAQVFYCDVLGFDLVQRYGPSALFVSAGGYHHHIGLNTWAGVGAPPAPPGSAGLRAYEIRLPTGDALEAVARRLEGAGIAFERSVGGLAVSDPASNRIVLVVA
ncbi:MAG: VOC family protein [Anaerolineae bacterium]|nr:VOC family protein [Anaerolineae bacterium]